MAKLKAQIAESSEELQVVGKKAKKRQAKAAAKAAKAQAKAQARAEAEAQARAEAQEQPAAPPQESESQPEGAMSRCALLCQEQRWREAALLCRRMSIKAQDEGKAEVAASLEGAQKKIEYSLRRQMAAAYLNAARDFLKKEYLLDVGK